LGRSTLLKLLEGSELQITGKYKPVDLFKKKKYINNFYCVNPETIEDRMKIKTWDAFLKRIIIIKYEPNDSFDIRKITEKAFLNSRRAFYFLHVKEKTSEVSNIIKIF